MSDVAVRVENLSKLYKIGALKIRHDTLRDQFVHGVKSLFAGNGNSSGHNSQVSRLNSRRSDTIWALKDVSFEIKHGEVVGFIGKNGAGKSTLLKILSRITEPTFGRVEIHGRVGSLLEVGTGFHGELTGRENIYLNGAILGMKKWEIDKKFDEIVAFAEIEKFIDTPVKRYSSGMYVRLAFAVAAHLEPDVLIVDEVLAVGDLEFQKRCLNKMESSSKEGRTILFVSHNLAAVSRICDSAKSFDQGRIVSQGPTNEVITEYQTRFVEMTPEWIRPTLNGKSSDDFAFLSLRAKNQEKPSSSFRGDQSFAIEIEYLIRRYLSACQIGIRVYSSVGLVVFYTADTDADGVNAQSRQPGHYKSTISIPGNFLAPGIYSIFVAAHCPSRNVYEVIEQTISFEVATSGSLAELDGRVGVLNPLIPWKTEHSDRV